MKFEISPETGKCVLDAKQSLFKQSVVASIRGLADFIESHEIPLHCFDYDVTIYPDTKEELLALLRTIGAAEKHDYGKTDDYLRFRKSFGSNVNFRMAIPKEKTCERVKVGEKKVAAVEAHFVEAQPETVEEIYEWQCKSLFANQNNQSKESEANAIEDLVS